MSKDFNYINIFNRSIFKKSTIEEMKEALKHYTKIEDYEKCMVIKELIDLNYSTDNPRKDDIEILTNIIKDYENDLNDLDDLSTELKDIFSDDEKNIDDNKIKFILNDIDDLYDDIVYNIMESIELRKKYLLLIKDDILNKEIPDFKKDKTKKLFEKYRNESIQNIEKVIKSTS